MATDSTNLPQGETTLDAGMTGSDLDHTTVQEVANEPANYVDLPKGNTVILLPVQPGQTVRLPTDSTDGVLAKIGPEGNLALVIDGRTIILQGFLKANDQSPIKIVTNDGDAVNVAELVAATDPSLDIQTAAGPASGDQGDTDGSGIYIPFLAGPGLGGILAEGILDPTALQYRNIDDDYILFTEGEEDRVTFDVTFDVLGGIVNEDDLPAGDGPGAENPQQELASAKFVLGGKGGHGSGMNGEGNDPFDTTDREDEPGDEDGVDDNGNEVDPDREPLETVATIKAKFPGSGAGTLTLDLNDLPTELKSHGELVSFEFIPGLGGGDLIRGFVDGGGDPTKFDHPDDRLVLTVEADTNLSPTGEFHVTFTLWDQIDHTTPQGLIGANEQIADLPVHFTLSGGGATADGTLPLGIEDDIPFFGKVIGCEIPIDIVCTDVEITHDETPGVQPGSDDVSVFNPWVFWLGVDVGSQVDKAGFEFPFGESEGSLVGAAKTKVHVSFGADGPTVFIDTDDADPAIRNSVFGALQDKSDGVIDDKLNDAGPGLENEHPFELFMVKDGTAPGSVTEGDLTIADQKTNATVTWGGTEPPTVLEVYVQQIDANTVVGYVQPDGPDGDKVAVFALNIDDSGCLSFFQIHQLNHNVDGPTFPDHDDPFTILGEDGTPLIYVRATDYDGDHAIAPVNLEVQDDGPKFCTVDWGHDNDSKHGVGLIDEDKLDPNGNNDWAPGDDKGGTHTDGKIIFDFGVDEPGHLEVKNLTVRDSAGNVLLNLTVDWATFDPIDGSIDVTGLNNLKTADGDAVTVTATLDPVSGLLTIVGEDADGNPAFTFKLDTSGADVGEFDFCLDQPLYHPYTDLDSKNDGPLKAFEDNLKFDFKVQGFDSDGDFATGHIKVNVDDDSPKAECDVDCVTEGKTDGELNFASGNVVTGNPPTAFDDDANHLDGNADAPGADQPYTISKLEHCGSEYVLVQEGDGTYHVEKGGVELPAIGDESFDPATGILTIPSHEGGSFEIVMVSDDQSKVGDYKYTVPENADHDVDKHFGPESLAESVSGDFDSPDDWVDSFGDHGITLAPIGGSLTVKDINVQGGGSPDYRGVGVANYPGDESEVDRGGNEGLKLTLNPGQFPFGANNIALTIGALFDGTQYDNTHQEILQWVAYGPGNIVVGSGQILGNNDGVVTVDIDTLLPFTRIELKPIDNGQGDEAGESFGDNSDFLLINAEICCPQDKFTEQFEYTLRDADGDESCATLKVDVKDTEPTHENPHTIITTLLVDEDGLPNGVGNTDSPFDNEEDHGGSNAPVDDAVHFGTIPFTPGADPTSIELTVFGGPDTGLKTLDNKKIFAAWDSTLKALIGYVEGTDPNDAANQVFKMTILDPLTGAYSFELLQAVKHDNTDIFGAANDTENVLNTPANFIVVAEIEDKDCDVIFSKVIVSIDDDMPVITPCYERGDLLVNGSFEDLGTEDGGTLENGNWGVFSQIPGWKSGADEANPSGLPGLEIQAGAVIAAKDGNNYVELDSDNLDQSDPAPSTTNASIYQDVTTNDGDNYVLSFSYSPRTGDENSDGIEVWFDGQLVTTLKSGTVGEWTDYTFVVKAGEGDGTPDLSRLEFKAIGSADELGGFIDDVSLTSCAIVDEDALPNGIEGGPGDDGPIGACFSGNLGVNFGADGGKSIVFNTTGQPTLFSHGVQVKYAWDNATQTLIGYTGANVPANWVFTVKVETLDNGGEYKFTLLKPLDHPDTDNIPNNENDHGNDSFEDNLIFDLKFKATDRDDDTVEGKLRINVDDDSPSGDLVKIKVDKYGDGALVHDETKGIDNPDDVAGPLAQFAGLEGSEGITAIGYAKTSVNVDLSGGGGNPNAAYGADGPGTTALSLTGPGGLPFSGAATNLFDTASGEPIFLYTEGGLVVGRIGSGGSADAGGDVSFALSIDNAGNLSVAQYRAIQHPDETNPDDSVTLLAAGGEDAIVHITAKITDYDGDAVTVTVPLDGEEGGNGAIKFEDDGPTATCDYDCVVEGKNDNVPNSAIGNVVTGANATIFGSDGNPFDGNPDNPGVDGPYTISKLAHGGTTYYLNDLGGGVFSVTEGAPAPAGTPIDGVTETFDGKTLKIPSAEGGTFEIVMVSPTQAEVGDYKYTVPCDADHAHDKHFGPESLAETRSEAFDHVDEWTAAFSADGITLTNLGGTGFAIKDIDVNPKAGFGGAEDYRGIGISGGIDGGEVDTHQETMQLQFATPTDNAEVQIGAFFDGTQFDNGFQEIIQWKALAADGVTVIASGQILGSDNGLVTLDIDTNGVDFSYIQLTPLNNGAGGNSGNNSDFVLVNVEVCCPEDKFQEQFDYTLRDGDGDESTATLKIDVKDTKPTIPHDGGPLTLCLTVDEDGLPAGVGNDFPVGSPNDAPGNSASAIGFIPFTPGADPVTIELSVGNGGDTGLQTLAGQTVLAAWDAESSTLIGYIAGTDPSDAANQVFKMSVTDAQTGAVTFDLLKPIKHADGGQDDNTENWPDPTLTVNVQIEDKDCDVAFTTVTVKIDDDMPVFKHLRADGDGITIHDETPGLQDDDQPLGSLPSYFKGLFNAGPAIGWAEDGESGVSVSVDFGADGPASSGSIQYDLSLTSNAGVDSGLKTTAGLSIWLFQEGDIVVGRVGSGATGETPNSGGAVALAVAIQDDGDLQVAQYLALKHPNTSDHDEDISISLAALQAKVTATDKDGDSVSQTVDIGTLIKFDDDGPNARDDFDNIQTNDGDNFFAAGNVITGASTISPATGSDIVGADTPGKITGVSGAGGVDVDPAGDFVVQGLYGKLTMKENGDYEYDLDEAKIGSIPSGATEQFNYRLTDGDGDNDVAKLTIKFPEAKIPKTEIGVGPNMNGTMKEDVSSPIYFEVDPQQSSDTVVHVKITGLIGWNLGVIDGLTVDILGPAVDSNITFDPVTGILEFDVTGAGAGNTITGFFNAIPPQDTDLDQPLAIEATVQDGPITAVGTDTTTVKVDAILDEYVNVEGADKSGLESVAAQSINLGLTAAFQSSGFANALAGGSDTDGSESHAVKLVFSAPLPLGTVVEFGLAFGTVALDVTDPSGKTYLVLPNTLGDLDDLVASIGLTLPAGFDGTISGQIQSASEEANTPPPVIPGNAEITNADNTKTDSANFSVTITPDVTVEALAAVFSRGGNYLKEDQRSVLTLTAIPGDGDVVTQIKLTNVPDGWDVASPFFCDNGSIVGAPVFDPVSHSITFDVTGATAGVSVNISVGLTAAADSDVDGIGLVVSATAQQGAVIATDDTTFDVTVDAVLDQYVDVSNSANTVDETVAPQVVSLNLTSTMTGGVSNPFPQSFEGTAGPDGDGSEEAGVIISVNGPANAAGVDLVFTGAVPAGVTLTEDPVDSGSWRLTGNSAADVQTALSQVGASLPAGFDGTVTGSITAITYEHNTPPSSIELASGNEPDIGDNVKVDQAEYTLTVNESDKAPINYNDAKSGDEPGQGQNNVMIIFDHSTSMDVDADGDGPGTASRLQLARAAVEALLNKFDLLGDVKVNMVIFATNATAMTFWGTVAEALAFLDDPANHNPLGSFTSYSDALAAAGAGLTTNTTGMLVGPDVTNTVYFLSDGIPTADGATSGTDNDDPHNLTVAQQTAWNTALETANVDKVFAVGVGEGIPAGDPDLEAVANPGGNPNNDPVGTVVIVTDENDLAAVLTDTVEGDPIEGNVLDGSIEVEVGGTPDNPGDAPAHIAYFSYTDPNGAVNGDKSITFTWDGNVLNALGVSGPAVPISITNQIAVFLTENGKMTFYFKDGSGHLAGDFEFIPNSISGSADATETFKYYTRDLDGDTEAGAPGDGSPGAGGATLIITINNINQGPVAVNDSANGTEGQVVTIPFASLLGNDTDPDGDSLTIQSVQGAVNGSVVIDGTDVKFTPNAGYFGPASFTYTINDGSLLTSTATVNLLIASNNVAPVGNIDHIYTNSDDDVTVQSAWLLVNDTDADGDPLKITSVDENTNKIASLNEGGLPTSFIFNLSNDNTSDGSVADFTYDLNDGEATTVVGAQIHLDQSGGVINGSAGNDIILAFNAAARGGAGDDRIVGYGSFDTLDYSDIGGDWNLTLGAGGNGTATVPGQGTDTYEGIENLMGGSGKNELTGNTGSNFLTGNGGDDKLDGGNDAVADTLSGGDGDDTLIWRNNADTYSGGANADILDVSETASINFTNFSDSKIESIETLKLAGGSGTTVTLNAGDVINFEGGAFDPVGSVNTGSGLKSYDSASVLKITGEAGDTVNLTSGGSDTWYDAEANGATGVPGGFALYVHVTAGSNPASSENAYVLIQDGVTVNLS